MKLSTIQHTLAELDVRPAKSLGQNFLHDQNLARWIVAQLELSPGDHLVEIGPGLGALTEFALPGCQSATLIDKDARLVEFLREHFASERVEIVHGDAAQFEVRTLFPRAPVKVLGNLPYYISSQILFRFTDEPSPAERLVFTLQKELAERMSAQPATKDYGILTLIIGRRWRVKLLRTLPASVFLPAPKVESAVILLTRREAGEVPDCDGEFFNAIVKQGFSQRRKQLRKMLAATLHETSADWQAVAKTIDAPETARGEELSLSQWIALANLLRPVEAIAQRVHEEIFDVVDEADQVTGIATRHEVHARNLRHRAVHIFVCNGAGELFLQKRSRWKDRHPGVWDSSAAGHVESGCGYDETAAREVREELGVTISVAWLGKIPASERTGFEFVHVYRAQHDGPFRLPPAEIETGAFFSLPLIAEWVAARPQDFASGFLECLPLLGEQN